MFKELGKVNRIYLGIGNYYGDVEAYEKDGKFYLALGNWDRPDKTEISEGFYNAVVKEFGTDGES